MNILANIPPNDIIFVVDVGQKDEVLHDWTWMLLRLFL